MTAGMSSVVDNFDFGVIYRSIMVQGADMFIMKR